MTIKYVEKHFIEKHFFKPKSINELKNTATIVIDTNVLLSAYQWREVTLREVIDALHKLSNAKRLKIPSHVVKEFMDQRPKRIVEIIQKIERELLSKMQRLPKLESIVPFIDMVGESSKYLEDEKKYSEGSDYYRKQIQEITRHVKDFFNSDPVLDTFEELIVDCYFELSHEETSEFPNEIKERIKNKIPPLTGGDNGKKENFDGDFIIWKHILSIDTDVIFVTSDSKDDWVVKDHHNQVLSPRRELIEEFFEVSQGKTFSILSPKDFVALYKPDIDSQIVLDLDKENDEKVKLFSFVLDVFNKYDPTGVYSMSELDDEYSSEVDMFIERLPKYPTKQEITRVLQDVIETQFGEAELKSFKRGPEIVNEIWIYLGAKTRPLT